MANKLSKKVLTLERPALGSYEPALSPKTAPDSFSHPEDAFDLETYIGQVAPAFTLPKTIELDAINEATSGQGVVIDGLLLKDGVYAFPASMTTFVTAAGNNAATSTVLTGKLNLVGAGTGGVALPTSPLFGQELYITNTTGVAINIYSNTAGSNLIVAGNGYTSLNSNVLIQHNEIFKFTFTDTRWVSEVITGPSSTLRADVISERTGTAGVTVDGVLLKDGLVVRKTAAVTTTGVTQTFNCGANNVIFITTTTGTDLAKLSNSVINEGHQITLVHAVDGGELVLSKLNAGDGVGFTTVTFTDAGDTATFVWSGTAWFIVGVNGAVVA